MTAIIRNAVIGLALVSSLTLASPVPLIVIASGTGILHYNIKEGSTIQYHVPTNFVLDAWGASKNEVWAVGTNKPGSRDAQLGRFDGNQWSDVLLGFQMPISVTLRAIHGTSASNVWVAGGTGEMPGGGVGGRTFILLHFDGVRWTKVIDGTYYTGISVFARGNDVWTRRIVENEGTSFDTGVQGIWGSPTSTTSDLYIACNDGLKIVTNVGCKSKSSSVSCQTMSSLGDAPNRGNTGYGTATVLGGFPGLPDSVVYTAGTYGFGGLYDGYNLVQDKTIPVSGINQSTYRSLMLAAPDAEGKQYMYAMANDAFLARRQV
ncbi:hypothetical protein BC829DRAFT_432060 [Chytridium lagenaria]|nr:hypothetical protein BC829DRAFT_432060 [Chytridium lagenaria]